MKELIFLLCSLMIYLGLIAAFIRLIKGPTRLDRALALEVITMLLFGLGLNVYMQTTERWLLDVLCVWAIVPFAGPLILTRTLTKGGYT